MPLPISARIRFGLLVAAGLLIALSFGLRHQPPSAPALLPPLPQDPLIQVFFNQSQAAMYTEPYRQQQRLGDDLEQVIVEAIATAHTSIDMAVQELRLPRIAQALQAQHQAGIRVRVILENTYSRPWSEFTPPEVAALDDRQRDKYEEFVQLVDQDGDRQISQAEIDRGDALVILRNARIPVINDTADGSKGSDLMHHKFVVIDQQLVVMGSANFTTSDIHGDFRSPDSRGNANHLLRITSPDLAQHLTREFNLMWGDGPGGVTDSLFGLQKPYRPARTLTLTPTSTVTVQVSPTSRSLPWERSVNGLISRALATATQSIDLALFVFSEQPLGQALEAQQRQGIEIRALIDPGFAYRNYSEALDMMGVALLDSRCRYEADNQPWTRPLTTVGIPTLAEGDLLHHKFGLVDRRLVITGSQNWSDAANHSNDENLLVIDNATVAAHFQREFERLYDKAILGVPVALQEKIQAQQAECQP